VALLFSPGFGFGPAEPPTAPDDAVRERLLAAGYLLAGLSYPSAGWAVEDGLRDQPVLAAIVRDRLPEGGRLIAWGHSMGGLVTAGLAERAPAVVDGALVLCGSVAGPLAMLDQALDAAFAIRCLVPGAGSLPLVGAAGDAERLETAVAIVERAATTADGRARLALAGAFAQLPTWSVPGSDRPAPEDVEGRAEQQRAVLPWAVFAPRADIERRSGGNPSGNAGVDYHALLARSEHRALVEAMYARSSLDLAEDLRRLAAAGRIAADEGAVDSLGRNLTPGGRIEVPVLTLHCSGDAAPTLSQAREYAEAVSRAGRSTRLRQAFVDRPGHIPSTTETVAALGLLDDRLRDGRWPEDVLADLRRRGAGGDCSFADLTPPPMLRPHRAVRP
jgi:pimeloyl-ACP methyl ester carboxylesterase